MVEWNNHPSCIDFKNQNYYRTPDACPLKIFGITVSLILFLSSKRRRLKALFCCKGAKELFSVFSRNTC